MSPFGQLTRPPATPGLPTAGYAGVQPIMDVFGPPADMLALGYSERLYWPLYDNQQVTAASTIVNYFTAPPNSLRAGNIERANSLPKPQLFVGRSIVISLQPQVTVADAQLLARVAVVQFTMNNRLYFQLPAFMLGGGGGVQSEQGGLVAAVPNATLGVASVSAAHYWPVPYLIQGEENFTFATTLVGGVAGLAANTDVQTCFLGLLFRKPTGQ